MRRSGQGGQAWLLGLAPPLVWFGHFSALYGMASFGNAARLDPAWFDIIAWGGTLVACLAVGAVWYRSRRVEVSDDGPARGASTVARALAMLSLVGILFQGLVLAIVAP